ncbi:MAG: cob(I)yrinic acid a,c-diamide adenosyltransferase [Trebonia sp.]
MTASRIYTKTGDDGTTGLLYGGRVSKGDELVDAYGDIDEAVAVLGAARAAGLEPRLSGMVLRLQRELFAVAADLAASPRQRRRLVPGISLVTAEMTDVVEQQIDALVAERPLRPVFVVPGTTLTGAMLDIGRAVVRRAERHAVRVSVSGHPVSDEALRYLNRLSDLLFILARHAADGTEEPASHE